MWTRAIRQPGINWPGVRWPVVRGTWSRSRDSGPWERKMTMEEREHKEKMRVETENGYVHGGSLGNEGL